MLLDFVSCQCQCNGQVSDKHNPNQIYCRRIKSKALNSTAVNQLVGWKGPLKHKSIIQYHFGDGAVLQNIVWKVEGDKPIDYDIIYFDMPILSLFLYFFGLK